MQAQLGELIAAVLLAIAVMVLREAKLILDRRRQAKGYCQCPKCGQWHRAPLYQEPKPDNRGDGI